MWIKQNVQNIHTPRSVGKHTIVPIMISWIIWDVRIIQGSHYLGSTVWQNKEWRENSVWIKQNVRIIRTPKSVGKHTIVRIMIMRIKQNVRIIHEWKSIEPMGKNSVVWIMIMRIKQNVWIIHKWKSIESMGKHSIVWITIVWIIRDVRIIQGSHYLGSTMWSNN